MELTTHTWDLASATGHETALAEASLVIAHAVLSPDYPGGELPFKPVVVVADDAAAYDRLAGFLGRSAG